MDIGEQKRLLRARMRATLQALPEEYIRAAGKIITERVLSLPRVADASSVFVYVSRPKEPDTLAQIRWALSRGKRVYVPRCLGEGHMAAVRIMGLDDLKPGYMGILEPELSAEQAAPDAPDVIVVPCLSADRHGGRLGWGGGYYDRFLKRKGHALTVCPCFERMLLEDIPKEPFDVDVDLVISERPN